MNYHDTEKGKAATAATLRVTARRNRETAATTDDWTQRTACIGKAQAAEFTAWKLTRPAWAAIWDDLYEGTDLLSA